MTWILTTMQKLRHFGGIGSDQKNTKLSLFKRLSFLSSKVVQVQGGFSIDTSLELNLCYCPNRLNLSLIKSH